MPGVQELKELIEIRNQSSLSLLRAEGRLLLARHQNLKAMIELLDFLDGNSSHSRSSVYQATPGDGFNRCPHPDCGVVIYPESRTCKKHVNFFRPAGHR